MEEQVLSEDSLEKLMYLVTLTIGEWEDTRIINYYVTDNKKYAEEDVERINNMDAIQQLEEFGDIAKYYMVADLDEVQVLNEKV